MDNLEAIQALTRESFAMFARALKGREFLTPFHLRYYQILDLFAQGKIRRLIVTMPPQHGKTEGSTKLLPAYLLGINPDIRIAIVSFSTTQARRLNRSVQRIMSSPSYAALFSDTRLNGDVDAPTNYARNADEFEVVNRDGGLMAVGRGGALTGNKVDVLVMDDLYKDAMEGNSPVVRDAVWDWYLSVAKTRLHNDSRELVVFTRWHEDDLIGRIEEAEGMCTLTDRSQVDPDFDGWYHINFEAVKTGKATQLDPRVEGEPLWPERHSSESLEAKRALDPQTFETMYQGNPTAKGGLLYGAFNTYTTLPSADNIVKLANYTDTADTGDDYLCSACYVRDRQGEIYITDVLYTRESMEMTEGATAMLLLRNNTRIAYIESNNGGRGFARNVQRLVPACKVEWFHQSNNKEARIMTNCNQVTGKLHMPADWAMRWPELYNHLITYRRAYKANRWHDAADVMTGIVEYEVLPRRGKIMGIGGVGC